VDYHKKSTVKMIFPRDKYLHELVEAKGNGMVKIVTGIRRSGKSFLLTTLFHQHLKEHTDNGAI